MVNDVNQDTLPTTDIRRALIDYRAEKNLSLRKLAKRIGGLTGATLGNIERGSVWPERKTILRIERFLRREGKLAEAAA